MTSTAETATHSPTRLLRQSVHGLTRSHWARAGQEPLHSTVGQETGAMSSRPTQVGSSVLVRHAVPGHDWLFSISLSVATRTQLIVDYLISNLYSLTLHMLHIY